MQQGWLDVLLSACLAYTPLLSMCCLPAAALAIRCSWPCVATTGARRRVRAMLAMRACRSSIMVGKPLDKARMQRVLQRLSQLDSPWNCPHGRCALLPSLAALVVCVIWH